MKKKVIYNNLEKKLLRLREKYNTLTNQLEETRKNSTSEAGILDDQQLIEDRQLIEKYMQKLQKQLENGKMNSSSRKKNNCAEIGKEIHLENRNTKLRFKLVDEIFSNEENQVSIKSPIGKAVLGRRVGENVKVVTPKKKIQYTIKSVK
jgi:transcription elongation factor GreA